MTEKELSKYYWLRKEIKDLEERQLNLDMEYLQLN